MGIPVSLDVQVRTQWVAQIANFALKAVNVKAVPLVNAKQINISLVRKRIFYCYLKHEISLNVACLKQIKKFES